MCIVGIIAGLLAARIPTGSRGSAHILLDYDRTIAGLMVVIVVFTLIARWREVIHAEWLLQLTAAGQSRVTFVLAMTFASAAFYLLLYILTIMSFGTTMAVAAASIIPLTRVPTDIFAGVIMLAAASCFATGVSVAFLRAATTFAAGVMAMPWLLLWAAVIAGGAVAPPTTIVRIVNALPPRTYVDNSLHGVAHQFLYIAAAVLAAVYFGNNTVARVP